MLKSYKYRIFPSDVQKEQLAKTFGCVRFIYNLGLETKVAAWTSSKKNLTSIDLSNELSELKEEYSWLKDCPSQSLQMSLRNLDNAYTNFFRRGSGFPKFKSKHRRQSFQLPQGVKISDDNKNIFIPKLKWVEIDIHRKLKGDVKTVTISKTTTGKYFISILVDNHKALPQKKSITENSSIGIDMGVKDLVITSDGKKFENKEFLRSAQRDLRVAQRSLARKVRGSGHYCEQKLVVALLHEKMKNQRQDYLHNISSYLVNKYDTICIEDLNVKGMSASCKPIQDESGKYIPNGQAAKSGLNKAILDMGWRELRTMLEYKAEWQGKNIQVIGRFEPSSKTCSCCGKINKELTLKDRFWICNGCNTKHDRDVNAAINIKNFGLRDKPSVLKGNSESCTSQREAIACA